MIKCPLSHEAQSDNVAFEVNMGIQVKQNVLSNENDCLMFRLN